MEALLLITTADFKRGTRLMMDGEPYSFARPLPPPPDLDPFDETDGAGDRTPL
jgi:hypothetical protein